MDGQRIGVGDAILGIGQPSAGPAGASASEKGASRHIGSLAGVSIIGGKGIGQRQVAGGGDGDGIRCRLLYW